MRRPPWPARPAPVPRQRLVDANRSERGARLAEEQSQAVGVVRPERTEDPAAARAVREPRHAAGLGPSQIA